MFKTKPTKYFSSFMADVQKYPLWGFTILFCCRIKMSPTDVRICDSAEAHKPVVMLDYLKVGHSDIC